MHSQQKLASMDFVWVHHTQALRSVNNRLKHYNINANSLNAGVVVLVQILSVVQLGHWTPDLVALDSGNVAVVLKLQPVGLVELGTNPKAQILSIVRLE